MKNFLLILLTFITINSFGGNPNEINLHLKPLVINKSNITDREVGLIGGFTFVGIGVGYILLDGFGHPKNNNTYIACQVLPIISGMAIIGISFAF